MELREIEREFAHTMHRFGKMNLGHFMEVSRGEFWVLASLERYEEKHPGEGIQAAKLAKLVDASPQGLSRTLRNLEGKGFLERRTDTRDRRNACICLTKEAHRIMEEGKEQMKRLFAEVVEEMGEDRLRELMSHLNRLMDVIQSVGEREEERRKACGKKDRKEGE
ncbi:MAG: winged helix-turn-helix transcriptional regulator [Lachnospiraceae bacterium]|nr:winged helix-turn-helix transcriptional regulator [Lachnospiraceae bacterium]